MKITTEIKNQMMEILKNKEIKSVFQPIVSLKTGTVFAYEALSRITLKKCAFNIGDAFDIAQEMNCLWALERLCRVQSIKSASRKPENVKLFLNVDPNIIHDNDFKCGVTHEKLKKNNLECSDIVFEATERSAINDLETFRASVRHYREQGFTIAVDDAGSGYSGINRIFEVNPKYIKIDIEMIKDIEKDELKQSFIAALSQFANDSGISLIAEGVETYAQLKTLISLNVDYAQGFYLAKPNEKFIPVSDEIKKEIICLHNEICKPKFSPSYLNTVNMLCSKKTSLSPDATFSQVYELMNHTETTEIAIVGEHDKFLGILTKRQVLQTLSGMYGYSLYARKKVSEIMDISCLTVTPDTPVETAAKMAMARCQPYTYDSIPVIDATSLTYLGFISIKDLLLTAINIQVKRANDCNPLTGLPGNIIIDKKIELLLKENSSFSIIYFDLDNFKAYNDAYGFTNGDRMIKTVAEILIESCSGNEFCGHIGGDDFVVITPDNSPEKFCEKIFEVFRSRSLNLYSEIDRSNGYIVSKNRHGIEEKFPLATLSAAAITNRNHSFHSMNELSVIIAQTKKQAKHCNGNSLVVY